MEKFLNKRDFCNVNFDCPCEDMRTSYIDFFDYDLHIKAKNITAFDPNKRYTPPFNTPVEKFSCIRVPLPYIINKIPDSNYNITPFDLHNLPTIKVLNEDFLFQQFFTPEESSTDKINQVFISSNGNSSRIIIRDVRKSPSFNTEPIHPKTKDIYYKNILDYAYQLGEPLFLHENNFFVSYTYSYEEKTFYKPSDTKTTIKTKYINTNIIDYISKFDVFGKTFPIVIESNQPPLLYNEPLEIKIINRNSFPDPISSFNVPSTIDNGLPKPIEFIPLFDLSVNFTGPSTYIYQFGEPTYELEKEKTEIINIVDTKIEIFSDSIDIIKPPSINPPKMTSYHELNKNFKFIHNNTECLVAIHQLNEPPRMKTLNYINYNIFEEIFDINILKPKPSETISDISNIFDLDFSNPRKIKKDSFFQPKIMTRTINFHYNNDQIYQIPDKFFIKDGEIKNFNPKTFDIYVMKKTEPFDTNSEKEVPFDFPEFEKINFYYNEENEYSIISGLVPGVIVGGFDKNMNDKLNGIIDFSVQMFDIKFAPSITKFVNSSESIKDGISTLANDIVNSLDSYSNIIITISERLPFIMQLGGDYVEENEFLEVFKGSDFSFKPQEYPILITPDESVTSIKKSKVFITQIGVPPKLIPRANLDYELYYYEKDMPPFNLDRIKLHYHELLINPSKNILGSLNPSHIDVDYKKEISSGELIILGTNKQTNKQQFVGIQIFRWNQIDKSWDNKPFNYRAGEDYTDRIFDKSNHIEIKIGSGTPSPEYPFDVNTDSTTDLLKLELVTRDIKTKRLLVNTKYRYNLTPTGLNEVSQNISDLAPDSLSYPDYNVLHFNKISNDFIKNTFEYVEGREDSKYTGDDISNYDDIFNKLPNKQSFITYKRNSIFQIGSPIAYDSSNIILPVEKNVRCFSKVDDLFIIQNMPVFNIKKYDIVTDNEYTIIRNIVPAPY